MVNQDVLYHFARLVTPQKETNQERTLNGVVKIRDGKKFVQLDGSDQLTPIQTVEPVQEGERVTVTLGSHQAVYQSNKTSPPARQLDMETANARIADFQNIIAYTITAESAEFLTAQIETLIATLGQFEELSAIIANLETLNAQIANIGELTAEQISALFAEFGSIKADIGQFTDIDTETLTAVNAQIDNIVAYSGSFGYLSVEKLNAVDAQIQNLEVTKLSAEAADLKYANIDFSNIGQAAVEKLFSESGIIENLVTKDGQITGELVGVTIKGDLIEGGTIKADKLVVKGSDGLFYKLNVDAMGATAEEIPDDKLHGSVIVAHSITAEKLAVSDLVAFNATIGGFHITDNALYSGVKASPTNMTQGTYLDSTGQVAFGDANSYLRYYQDEGGVWRFEIVFGNKSLEEMISEGGNAIKQITTYYMLQTQDVEPPATPTTNPPAGGVGAIVGEAIVGEIICGDVDGGWVTEEPSYTEGSELVLYETTLVVYEDETFAYTPVKKSASYEGDREAWYRASGLEEALEGMTDTLSDIHEAIQDYATKNDLDLASARLLDSIHTEVDSILMNGSAITQLRGAVEGIQNQLVGLLESSAHIRMGWIDGEFEDEERTLPVFGIAIGEEVEFKKAINGVDDEVVVHPEDGREYKVIAKKKFLAIYTASGISFWRDGVKVAYIHQYKLYINNVVAVQTVQIGSDWQIDGSNDLIFRYIGG